MNNTNFGPAYVKIMSTKRCYHDNVFPTETWIRFLQNSLFRLSAYCSVNTISVIDSK